MINEKFELGKNFTARIVRQNGRPIRARYARQAPRRGHVLRGNTRDSRARCVRCRVSINGPGARLEQPGARKSWDRAQAAWVTGDRWSE